MIKKKKKNTLARPRGGRFQDARYGPYDTRSGVPEAWVDLYTLDMPEREIRADFEPYGACPKRDQERDKITALPGRMVYREHILKGLL